MLTPNTSAIASLRSGEIVMTESGAFVVDTDANSTAERSQDEFPDEDVRQIALRIELLPPSLSPEPKSATERLD